MNSIDFIQLNKFAELHNNRTVFFCKTDYILRDFETINKQNNNVIFITGNSDYPITDELVSRAPKNIKRWYCQNALSKHDIIRALPIGLENKNQCIRDGHGIGYTHRVTEKEQILSNLPNIQANKFIYANFNSLTNREYRISLQSFIENIDYIDWHEPNLTLVDLFHKFLEYQMVLCPIGNGVDTHRLWEVLYCNRIPITIKVGNFALYDIYKNLPIVILDKINDLNDKELIIKKYNEVIQKTDWNKYLNYSYWKNIILEEINAIL